VFSHPAHQPLPGCYAIPLQGIKLAVGRHVVKK
jgi:hypothetical protein